MNVNDSSGELLNVRDTARLLGVHENTVRNWAKSGILPEARIPGSHFHRFRRADVELMRTRNTKRNTSAYAEHQTIGPELVDATQLNIWASTKAAQIKFPELMRRLLAATPGVREVLIRANEGVAIGGWDGSSVSQGTKYLPIGNLRFEFGVDAKVKKKADDEFDRHETEGVVFVFATPRRWGNAQKWAEKQRAKKKFADVWVVDADVLEGWLTQVPAVHQWISEQLGRRPSDAQSLENWWDQFSGRTEPKLPSPLFLAGRNEQAGQLQKFLAGSPGFITIRTEWASDARAFIYVASRVADRNSPQKSVILVDTPEVWNRIVAQPSPTILIPTYEDADVAAATNAGHHVILILDQSSASTQTPDLVLSRLDRIAAAEALQVGGVNSDVAQRYSVYARRNLQAFVRSISINPKYNQPQWAQPPLARGLAKLALIGEWTTSEGDIKLVERLVGQSWEDIEQDLERVSGTDDPVFRKIGQQWSLTSPGEAFTLLAPALRTEDMKMWSEVIRTCLLEVDPRLDLNGDDRPMAALRGIKRQHSSVIRKGMARSAALLGARCQEIIIEGGQSLSNYEAGVLGTIFADALADTSGRKWEEIVDVLPLLAEAAPENLLDALDQDLSREQPGVVNLFQEGKEPSRYSFGPDSPHPWLLWALETMAWSKEYFMDSVRILAKLAALDPGGNSKNRPLESLAAILCGWASGTSASAAQKSDALALLYEHQPGICWELLIGLWPSNQGFMIPPAAPHIQDWQPTSSSVLMSDWVEYSHAIVDYSIKLAAGKPERMTKLVEGLANVTESDQAKILEFIKVGVGEESGLDSEQRFQVWEQIQSIVARHERFSSANWSLKTSVVTQLKAILSDIEPTTDPKRFAYLFDWHPDLPDVDPGEDLAEYDKRLAEVQREAVRDVLEGQDPMLALQALTKQARVPSHVGWAMADNDGIVLSDMIPWLASPEASLNEAGGIWFAHKAELGGAHWLEEALDEDGLSGEARAVAVLGIPSKREFWDVISKRPSDADLYWSRAHVRAFNLSIADAEFAIEQLIEHGRALAAAEVMSDMIHQAKDKKELYGELREDLIVSILNKVIEEDPRPQDMSNMTSYYVGALLDHLADSKVEESTMARFEFAFFRMLEHTRKPQFLDAVLARDPEVFVDLAKRVYSGKSDPKAEPTEREQQLGQQAWWVLHGWKGFPGCKADGTIDFEILDNWVKTARLQFLEADRADIGDELVGGAFAHSPTGSDGAWPAEPIRDLIENIGNERFEEGLRVGRYNTRGVVTRSPYEGGGQERALAKQYREWATTVKVKWPRTARLLRQIADGYDYEARREDIRAEIEGDRE